MKIPYFQKFSLIDYPGKISTIIFTQGCNFRCPYCHNPELVNPELFTETLEEEAIFSFLRNRKNKLDAVVITGGEPTLQPDLMEFAEKIKEMGYLVKLDTNGSNPGLLRKLINRALVDYVAMDIKATLEKYPKVARVNICTEKIKESIEIILRSDIDYEFRTTVVKPLLEIDDLIGIAELIKGAKKYVIQKFVSSKILDKTFLGNARCFSEKELNSAREKIKKYVGECVVR